MAKKNTSQEPSTAVAQTSQANAEYILNNPLVARAESVDNFNEGFVQRTIPFLTVKRMIPGMTVTGVLVEVEKSTQKGIANPNLVLQDPITQQKVKMPCTAVIMKALNDDPNGFIGHTIRVIYKGKAETAAKGKNKANLFEVFTKAPDGKKVKQNS